MFCKNCGKELDDNAVVCTNCGLPTDKFKAEIADTTDNGADNNLNKHNVFAIVGFVLAALTIVFTFWSTTTYFLVLAAGLTLSIIGLVNCKKYRSYGKGLSIAGISISGASLIVWIIAILVIL